MLRHWRLTPTAFAALDEADQSAMLGYELFRARQMAELRAALAEKEKLTPEAAVMLMIEGV